MADEKVVIGIETPVKDDGAKKILKDFVDVGKETVTASKHATQLLYIIRELTKQLDGVDSESAKVLRQELANLSETINSLDLDRLKHLDAILANIAKTGADLSAEGFEELEQNLTQLNAEAKKFKETFSNENQVQVDVDVDGLDDLDALQKKIEGTAAANELVNSLKAIKDEAAKANDDALKPMAEELDRMIALASNAGPQSVEQLRSSFASLAGQVVKLTATQKENIKAFNFDKISGQLDTLQDKVGTVASRMKNGGEAINATASILQGNLSGVGDLIKTLITRTEAWSKAMSAVGVAKASAAIGIFITGMTALVNLGKQWVEYMRSATREMEKQNITSHEQVADDIKARLDYADKVAERNKRMRDIEVGTARARQANEFDAEIAAINLRRQEELAANPQYNAEGRAEVNRQADRQIQGVMLRRERAGIENAEADRVYNLREAEERNERIRGALNKLQEESLAIAREGNKASREPDWYRERIMAIGDNFGLDNKDAILARIKNATDAGEAVSNIMRDLREQLKDNDIEIKKLQDQEEETKIAYDELNRKKDANLAARQEEEAQVKYELENQQMNRGRELAERARENAEADEQAKLDHEATMQNYEERRAALVERRAKREKELAEKEAKLKAFAGIAEADLSDREKTERQWLEQDVERLRGQVRSDDASINASIRQGDTEGYARRRELFTEDRDAREADRQMLRQWQNSRLGLGGRTADAASELERQKGLLEKEQDNMKAFIAAVENRTGKAFRYEDMTDEEKAQYGDLRADIRMRREGVRGAQGEYYNALLEGQGKDVEFRNSLKESNRLVSLGLAGGGEFQWGKDTASNTSKMVSLLEEVNANLKGEGKGGATGGVSAQYGY